MRVRFVVRGTVQGVGFRPFVRRLALANELAGTVQNGRDAVRIEVQGSPSAIDAFAAALERELPPAARIRSVERATIADEAATDFTILASETTSASAAVLPPDLATCEDCRREARDPADRRYRYPFASCIACGPRFSIATALPYDRARTTMAAFPLCEDCAREYADVEDRRYHAQPIACPRCGPQLGWSVAEANEVLKRGGIVALCGLGGYQLLCDAANATAVAELRRRKARPDKPFAVLFRDLATILRHAHVSEEERRTLTSPEAPIVLLERRSDAALAEHDALVGAMLPPTILHEQLLEEIPALICTSGNLAEEPICITEEEARSRLGRIADGFLVHDRAIARPLDDSIVRIAHGRARVLRRGRGYAPRAVAELPSRATVLALGAHLKGTVALAHGGAIVPSQHLGDLDALPAQELLRATVEDLLRFFDARPDAIVCDLHPDYASTILAEELARRFEVPLVRVQHHHAHVAAVLAEHGVARDRDVLGLAWDGTGYGEDATIWGAEALFFSNGRMTRVGSLRPFPLLGGDAAARDPKRCALGLVHAFAPEHLARLELGRHADLLAHAPRCSSIGRLFDAVAALLGAARSTFEGQAAMELEAIAHTVAPDGAYPLPFTNRQLDPEPLVRALLADDAPRAVRARRFHEALIEGAVAMAAGYERVALSGGCFQNRLLLEGIASRLEARGIEVLVPEVVPTNDGGIAVGQAWLGAPR